MKQARVVAFLCVVTTSAVASDVSQFYLSAGAGGSKMKPDDLASTNEIRVLDKEDTGFRLGAGYRFNPKVSAEVFYTDLGQSEVGYINTQNKAKVSYSMLGMSAIISPLASDQLGGFNWLLEAGVGKLDIDEIPGVANKKTKDAQFIIGTGLEYAFNHHITARFLAESYDEKAVFASLGFNYTFGAPKRKSASESDNVLLSNESKNSIFIPKEPKPAPNPDLDGDGILNTQDCCPNTPKNTEVDVHGCMVLDNDLKYIKFEYRSNQLTQESQALLDSVVKTAQKMPTLMVSIGAHTDNIGSAQYNQKLSESRAKVVSDYLMSKGLNSEQVFYKGYGESEPIATNSTAAGRAQNRRVELEMKAVHSLTEQKCQY